MRQKTLKHPIEIVGVGLHSGRPARVLIYPAREDRGIVFRRVDLAGQPEIGAHYRNVVSTQMATTLGRGAVSIGTVEHLMAALHVLGVDNAVIEVFGPEVPILDGSSKPFFEAIARAGLEPQRKIRSTLAIRKRIELKMNEKWAVVEPSARLEVHGSIEFDHPAIGYQEFTYSEGKTSAEELIPARTFGFLREVQFLQKNGLARGGSLDNAVVVDDIAVLNQDGLRFSNEFARHKVLDALGDFKLAGISLLGHFRLHRAGHDLHSKLLEEILRNPDNYEIIGELDPLEEHLLQQASGWTRPFTGWAVSY
jgi:UDP-3-O-[3-hydroxymyristoyl] N-acetylglucosamine deacetylase